MNNKIIFFINKSNNFANALISYVELNFPENNYEYYIIDRRQEEKLVEAANVHRILSYGEFISNKE